MKKKSNPTELIKRANKVLNHKAADYPDFRVGDTIKVHVKVQEGGKTRIQLYEGLVIAKRGAGGNASFTVRKISYGVGVERIFPMYSPVVSKITLVSRGEVRRAKLYYLRALRGRKARIKSDLVFGVEAHSTPQLQTEDAAEASTSETNTDTKIETKAAQA